MTLAQLTALADAAIEAAKPAKPQQGTGLDLISLASMQR